MSRGGGKGGEGRPGAAWEQGVCQLEPVSRGANAKSSWWILVLAVAAPSIAAQGSGEAEGEVVPPRRLLDGMPMAHDAYQMEAFDCDEPQDIITRSIPKSCNSEMDEEQEEAHEGVALEDYTILQKVVNFEYTATLCTLQRSRQYFDCRFASHVRVAAPAKIYAQETLRVEDCMRAKQTGVFMIPGPEANICSMKTGRSTTHTDLEALLSFKKILKPISYMAV